MLPVLGYSASEEGRSDRASKNICVLFFSTRILVLSCNFLGMKF